MAKAILWMRVSTEDQSNDSQRQPLEEAAARAGDVVVDRVELQESAYRESERYNSALRYVQAAIRNGRAQVLYVWAIDRLSRQGPLATLKAVDDIYRSGGRVVSLQDSWLESAATDQKMREMLLAITGWVASAESERRSQRIKAGIAAKKARGQSLGRPAGAKDKKPRRSRLEADIGRKVEARHG